MLLNTVTRFLIPTILLSITASRAVALEVAYPYFTEPQFNDKFFNLEQFQPSPKAPMENGLTMDLYFPGSEELVDHDEGCYLTSKPRMTCQASACDHVCVKSKGKCVIGTRGTMLGCGSCKCAS